MNDKPNLESDSPLVDLDEVRAIILAEFAYWKAAPEIVTDQAMGAMGATANILCAIHGHRAPWHPKRGVAGA